MDKSKAHSRGNIRPETEHCVAEQKVKKTRIHVTL